jgi:ADP-ribosyl-[dinitrogen reductase] hydrolase
MPNPLDLKDRFRGCLLGLAAGDAVGTTVEFLPRGSFSPVTDMVGGGPFNLEPGQWTDDTSMALCLGTSLVETGRFDLRDQIERYCRWHEQGYLSSNGECFDIGSTVAAALRHYRSTGNPRAGSTDPQSAGNGSIMRLAPVPMFFYPDEQKAVDFSAASSRSTHGALECVEACRLLARILLRALAGAPKHEVLAAGSVLATPAAKIAALARQDYLHKKVSHLRGSGYVVESLEAALWSFAHTDSFDAAILKAANLGDDADTTAAVCGQIAGAFYGEPGIPSRWLERLARRDYITDLSDRLRRAASN